MKDKETTEIPDEVSDKPKHPCDPTCDPKTLQASLKDGDCQAVFSIAHTCPYEWLGACFFEPTKE